MQQRILFFAMSLMFTLAVSAESKFLDNAALDACFAKLNGYAALKVACSKIKSEEGAKFEHSCADVAGIRALVLFYQRFPPKSGTVQAAYIEFYNKQAWPEYTNACFPKKTAAGGSTAGTTGSSANSGNGGTPGGATGSANQGGTPGGNAQAKASDPASAKNTNKDSTDDTSAVADRKERSGSITNAEADDAQIESALANRKSAPATGANPGIDKQTTVGSTGTPTGAAEETGASKIDTKSDVGTWKADGNPEAAVAGGYMGFSQDGTMPGSTTTTSFVSSNPSFSSLSASDLTKSAEGIGPFSSDTVSLLGIPLQIPAGEAEKFKERAADLNKSATDIKVSTEEFKGLEGVPNTAAWTAMKTSVTKLYEAGKFYGADGSVSQIQNAVQKYIESSKSCSSVTDMADMACIEDRNPIVKQIVESARILAPVLQTATGLNDSCNKIARAMGKINKGLLAATVICGGFQAACNLMCGNNKAQLEVIQGAIKTVGEQIMAAASKDVTENCATSTPACGLAQQRAQAAKAAMTQAVGESKKVAAAETNASNPASLAKKIATCGSFTDTLRKTTQGLIGLAQTNMQAKDCAKKSANNDNPNKCQDPNYEGSMECLCQRAEFKNTASCREYTTGCAIANQMKNAAGVCVAITEACKDAVNASKPECSTTVVAHCMKPENASNKECICMLTPNAVACGGNGDTTLNGGLTAGTTGTSNNIVPTNTTTPNNNTYVDGGGLQKMGNGRNAPVDNLNKTRGGSDRMTSLGTDGNLTSNGAEASPTGYSDPNAAGAGTSVAGGASGGLGAWGGGGRDPASDANGKGKAGGGYKGASAEALGGGGGGWGSGGLNWGDREKNKNEALQKINAAREKARMAGLTTLKENGITGPTGKTLWEKVTTRYRESKATLLPE